ncbi:hypothetical protein GCM10027020_03800 [Nocardioides salsibiostraticola]
MIRMIRTWRVSSIAMAVLVMMIGCTPADEAVDVEPSEPPMNVCESVPTSVIEGWRLRESDHAATLLRAENRASCAMTGSSAGSPVDLDIDLVFFGGTDRDSARAAAQAELSRECDSVASQGGAPARDSGCRLRREGEALAVAAVPLADAVLTVRMSSASERGETALAADVEAVIGALITLERCNVGCVP